ncbi:MAG TPA: hypothetical protein VF074_23915 [Pyrinomonadaceae bacterium]
MKTRNLLTMSLALIVVAALGVSVHERHASATPVEIGNLPTIRGIALGRGLVPEIQLLAILTQNSTGHFGLNVTSVGPLSESGSAASELEEDTYLAGTFPLVEPGLPGDPAWHVFLISLDSFIQQVQVSQDSAGRYQLTDPATIGQFGNPTVHGRPTALAVLPTPRDPTGPWFAIGTDTGNIILAKSGIEPCAIPIGGPVVDLAVVPQLGYFAFVALVNRRDGQHLVAVRPTDGSACATGPSPIVFDLTPDSPETTGVLLDLHGFIEPSMNVPLNEPAAFYLIAANGTRFIQRLTIPADPRIGGSFSVRSLKAADSPLAQAVVGPSSLAMLPVDGAGVLYDPGFRMDRGGVSGKLLTVFGSSLEVRPRQFSLQGRRRSVSIFIEVANGNAALIDRASLDVRIGGTSLANGMLNPQLEPDDDDHDGNLDLEVKINRDAVQSLIPIGATSVTIAASWRFNDGSLGRASAEIRIKSQGDDDDDDED